MQRNSFEVVKNYFHKAEFLQTGKKRLAIKKTKPIYFRVRIIILTPAFLHIYGDTVTIV